MRRGIADVVRHLKPHRIDFIPEDVYVGLRNGACTLHLVSRETRTLGFLITYVQTRPFSGKRELLCWIAWSIPLRERLPGDNVPLAALETRDFLKEHARKLECDRVVMASSRKGIELVTTTSCKHDVSIRSTAGPDNTACVAQAPRSLRARWTMLEKSIGVCTPTWNSSWSSAA